ncbi:MAG: hypothetical protein EOO89_07255, partial [Pedobacter sp.]
MSNAEEKTNTRRIIFIALAVAMMVGVYFAATLYMNYFAGNVTGNQEYLVACNVPGKIVHV